MDVYYIRNMYSIKCNKITLNNLHQAGLNKPTNDCYYDDFLMSRNYQNPNLITSYG